MIVAKEKKGCVHSSSTIIMEREREREPRDIRGDGRCKKNPRLIGQSHPYNVGEKQKGILLQAGSRNNNPDLGPALLHSLELCLPACLPSLL